MPRSSFNRDLLTGLVAIAGIIGLVVMMWRFGELYRFTRKSYPLYVRMTAVNGLSSTSGVTLKGVRVGAISDIETTNEGVLITMQIREPNKVPKGMTVYIDRSFVGEGTLDFRPPSDPTTLVPNSFLVQGEIIPEASQPPIVAASLFSDLNDTVKGPIQSMGKAADRIEVLATSLDDTAKKFSEMIEPRTLAEVDSGAKQPNLRSALARADQAIASANKWLGDESALADAKASLSKLNRILDEAQALPDSITTAVKDASGSVTNISDKVGKAIDQAQETMKTIDEASTRLRDMADAAQKGEGTIGQLLRNPDLYNNLNQAALRLETAIEDARQLIDKFKKEGLPLKLK